MREAHVFSAWLIGLTAPCVVVSCVRVVWMFPRNKNAQRHKKRDVDMDIWRGICLPGAAGGGGGGVFCFGMTEITSVDWHGKKCFSFLVTK